MIQVWVYAACAVFCLMTVVTEFRDCRFAFVDYTCAVFWVEAAIREYKTKAKQKDA